MPTCAITRMKGTADYRPLRLRNLKRKINAFMEERLGGESGVGFGPGRITEPPVRS
jgi:hypothetical protein